MEIETSFLCIFCFQENLTLVDSTGGSRQVYTEDCQVCCRPNLLHVRIDASAEEARVEATAP